MTHGEYTITTRSDSGSWVATIARTDGKQFTTFPEHDQPRFSVETMRFHNEAAAIEEAKKAIDGRGMKAVK